MSTYTVRINLGLGFLFACLVAFPFTPNDPAVKLPNGGGEGGGLISIVMVSVVGVFDYISSGSLTQMARCVFQ